MIATYGFLTTLECTKFVFGRGSAPDSAGELTALPRLPIAGLTARGGEGKGKGEGEGRERKEGKRRWEVPPPLFANSWIRP